MASDSEISEVAIPSELTDIDWEDPRHKRIIAASLVQGVYEYDKNQKNINRAPSTPAPPGREIYGFKLEKPLDDDITYFGAIYEYKDYFRNIHDQGSQNPPRYVIAFRGTSCKHDIGLLWKLIRHKPHKSTRYDRALKAARDIVDVADRAGNNVWLAGHSLGSSIAMFVGRKMVAEDDIKLETFLFNPPFGSLPLEIIVKNKKLKNYIHILDSFIKAGMTAVVDKLPWTRENEEKANAFTVLSEWVPHLFINPSDPICSAYIDYFELRREMTEDGNGEIVDCATQNSKVDLLYKIVNKDDHEPIDLIPSAHVIENRSREDNWSPAHSFLQAYKLNFMVVLDNLTKPHKLEQWLRLDINYHETHYKFNNLLVTLNNFQKNISED